MEKNLQSGEAIKKLKRLVEDIKVCMFITNHNSDKEHTRPMYTIEVEDDGILWFFTDLRSIKVEEVSNDKLVHLTYAHPGKDSYLDTWGNAQIITDKALIKDKWKAMLKAWFPNGPDDPSVAILKVKPTECYYWDSETGKMVEFLKMAAAIVTGKRLADGAEVKLSL